jgi:signal transduction histidine kinase
MGLSRRTLVSVFSVLIVAAVVNGWTQILMDQGDAEEQFVQSAEVLADAVHVALEHAMLSANREHIQELVSEIAGEHINEVIVVSRTQEVYASGEVDEIGTVRDDDEIAEVLRTGESTARKETQYDEREFCVIEPVTNHPECHGCHGSQQDILGAIEVGVSMEPLAERVASHTGIMGLIWLGTFGVIGAVLTFMQRSSIINPLSQMAAAARRIAEGDLETRLDVRGRDEVGALATSFNDMAQQVGEHAQALERANEALEDRVRERTREVDRQLALRSRLLHTLISAQEDERRRIARELHDDTGQMLSSLLLTLSRSREALPSEASEASEMMSQAHSQATETLAGLRSLIDGLRPEVLDQLGLVPAIRSYAKRNLESKGIEVTLSFRGPQDRLPPERETTVFRVVQEALANAVRHSGASSVGVSGEASGSGIVVTVTDNGVGFDWGAVMQNADSWGLHGMQERVNLVGGELTIESTVGQGTRIRIVIPG